MKRYMMGMFSLVPVLLIGLSIISADAKPLQVFILCGQSNMEGHAQTRTFPAVAKDRSTKAIYDKMVDAEGNPVVLDDVWISYAYGNFSGDPIGRKAGNLTAGWGSQHHVGTGKIGPEFKGNVINVFSEKYWPSEIDAIQAKINPIKSEGSKKSKALKSEELSREDFRAARAKINAEVRTEIESVLTEDELYILDNGVSNQGFHYHGSAKFFAQLGKAFADALVALEPSLAQKH